MIYSGPRLNGQVLVEFSRIHETEPSLRVKSATLWVYVQLKGSSKHIRRLSHDKKPTLYIFRVASHRHNSTLLDKVKALLLISDPGCSADECRCLSLFKLGTDSSIFLFPVEIELE